MSDKIYALYPLNENGGATGIYIGITSDVERRIKEHVYSGQYWIGNKPITDFAYQILDEVDDPRLEYDYIDLFKMSGLNLLNKKLDDYANATNALLRLISRFDFHYKSRKKED